MADHSLTLKAYLDTSQVKAQISLLNSQGNVNLDASGITNSLNRLNDVIGKFIGSLDKLQQNTAKQAQQSEVNYNRLAKFAAGMATHQLAGAAGRYFDATGSGIGGMIGSFGNIAQSTAMGAAAGGAAGAGIGFAVGTISQVLDSLADSTKNARDAVEQFAKTLDAARSKDKAWSDYLETRKISLITSKGTKEQIAYELGWQLQGREKAENELAAFEKLYGSAEDITRKYQDPEVIKEMMTKFEKEVAEEFKLPESFVKSFLNVGELLGGDRTGGGLKAWNDAVEKLKNKLEDLRENVKTSDKFVDMLSSALEKRIKAEKDAADATEKKNKAEEEQAKKLAEANAKHLDALKRSDTALEEGEGINEILKQSDVGTISETLSKYKSLTELAYAKYQEDLAGGDAEKATTSRSEWIRLRGYQKSLEGGLESMGETDLQNRFGDVQKLFSNLINPQTLSNLGAIGLSFGENMGQEDQLEKLLKIIDKLQQLIDQGKDKQLANFTLG